MLFLCKGTYSSVEWKLDTTDLSTIRTLQCGPLCKQTQQPVGSVHQLAPRPICNGYRYLPDIVAGYPGICLPSLLLGREMSPKDSPGKATMVMVAPVLLTQPWYPMFLESLIDLLILLTMHSDMLRSPSTTGIP